MLARTFLRLCALEALRPSALLAANGPWPTSAGVYVSDSRIDPIDDLNDDERRPLIAVYTEDDHLIKIAQSGPVFYKSTVDLVFEISVVQKFAPNGEGAEPIVDYCDTDAGAEAALDGLEDNIFHALHFGPTGKLFRQIAKVPADERSSHPKRAGEESIRLSARTVRYKFCLKEVCYQAAPLTTPAGLDRLPPVLKAIAEQFGSSTYLAEIALGVARTASVMSNRIALDRVTVTANLPAGNSKTSNFDNLQGTP
jgi:hypothetical protein